MIIHLHMGAWFVAVVLFITTYLLSNASNTKAAKIVSMITRVFYLLILGTGLYMVTSWGMQVQHLLKMLLGLFTLVMMELVLVRKKKGQVTLAPWIAFIISIAATIFYGYYI